MNKKVKFEAKTRTQRINNTTYKSETDIRVNGRKVGTSSAKLTVKYR